jgi:formate C-acetyltransferase
MKHRMLTAPFEICMARARHFTDSYRETEGLDPALRNALALRRTLERQRIRIDPDERLAGSKTEKTLAGPLSIERGDFLRTLQLEMDVLHLKRAPFRVSDEDRALFWNEILPYWDGRTARDRKAREWERRGLIRTSPTLADRARQAVEGVELLRYVGQRSLGKLAGASRKAPLTPRRVRNLHALRHEYARNNPTPAVYCFDVQGHLSLGVDNVVREGMDAIAARARERLEQLRREAPYDEAGASFLRAVVVSLEAAVAYAERFAALAETMLAGAADESERARLCAIAEHCRRVPRLPARTFHEGLQAAWMAHVVGEIQYGTHDVFAAGRVDQFLCPLYRRDLAEGRIDRAAATALLQEYFLKLSANVEPIPEAGMETNAVLGNSQHCVTIGGLTPGGSDGTNELTFAILDAYEQMGGTVNQLCVRLHDGAPPELLRRAAAVFRVANGIALYNDRAVVEGLVSDGMAPEHARDYCIVGCVETSGQSDTHGCPGGHELVLPAVLMLALTSGRRPPPALGQQAGFDGGDACAAGSFEALLEIVRRQLSHQIGVLVQAAAGKDLAHRELLPAPYVSALMHGCIERARDITAGGARYDFTSVDVRGLATFVDSLLAIQSLVFERRVLALSELLAALERDFEGDEVLRSRLLREPPKFGTGEPAADAMALRALGWIDEQARRHRNVRGGRFRACYYSYGNHVVDGLLLGATPDGRRRGTPISNGVSASNLVEPASGPMGPMRSAAKIPPRQASSGISLNMRFHPRMISTERGLATFAGLIRTYFSLGGMHVQPNVVSAETLRAAQRDPDAHRDLVVKVSGYSAYFTDLGRSIQQDIIDRAEYGG